MNLGQLTDFFEWMAIINVSIFLISTLFVMLFKTMVAKFQGKLFGIKETDVALMVYGYLAVFKILIIVFVLVPYISLLLIH